MNLASFTLMRNERPILGPFMDQLHEFFDHSILLDHESTDSTLAYATEHAGPGIALYRLKSTGYPQSEVATRFLNRIMATTNADWLFFLDCDEFLPFESRAHLESALKVHAQADVVHMYWRNVAPQSMDGGNILTGKFITLKDVSRFPKYAISRRLYEREPGVSVYQGYHGFVTSGAIADECLSESGLIHIPVQSRRRFAAKIASGARRLIGEGALLGQSLGSHWLDYYRQLEAQGLEKFDFAAAAITYAGDRDFDPGSIIELSFSFPYVREPYVEDLEGIVNDLMWPAKAASGGGAFIVSDVSGAVMMTSSKLAPLTVQDPTETEVRVTPTFQLEEASMSEFYNTMIEPLFSLPLKLPVTAWTGHIPFIFALFRLMRPRNYVELGVHNGASLIAAATAARAYQIPMRLWGVDAWTGDEHAGFYEGERIYRELKSFCDAQFRNVELVRSFFDDANARFADSSIDVLHIDGLHTYDAVKHDFETWLPKMSSCGVVLFHDTTVRERGFGVFRLWAELEKRFATIQFFHSFGLGVLLLDPHDRRIRVLAEVSRNAKLREFYQSLVSDIGGLVEARMKYIEDGDVHRQLQETRTKMAALEAANTGKGVENAELDGLLRLDGAVFIEAVYHALLKRSADATGMQNYLGRLECGTPKMQILTEISGSPEARQVGVTLPGLEEAVKRHRVRRRPIIGSIARLLGV
jgi:hypothetical protein